MELLKYDMPCVLGYLQMLQGVINRMATNSTSCKKWCITIITGVIAIVANKSNPSFIWIALVPAVLFAFLDSYYLAYERCLRSNYKDFVQKLHGGNLESSALFIISARGTKEILSCAAEAVRSTSVWPFYGLMLFILIMIRAII